MACPRNAAKVAAVRERKMVTDAEEAALADLRAKGLQFDPLPLETRLALRQVAAGDEVAFAELYDHYAPSVYNYLLRLVNESAVAEEILQEVFLAMWRGAHRFREEAKVKTWLLRIAHHQAVS